MPGRLCGALFRSIEERLALAQVFGRFHERGTVARVAKDGGEASLRSRRSFFANSGCPVKSAKCFNLAIAAPPRAPAARCRSGGGIR